MFITRLPYYAITYGEQMLAQIHELNINILYYAKNEENLMISQKLSTNLHYNYIKNQIKTTINFIFLTF